MTRPPAGTVRGPLDGGVLDGEPGVPGAEPAGRAAGGRLGAALPGRDDTTRGAGETGCVADGAAGCVDDGVAAAGCAGVGDVGVVGSVAAGATIWGGGVGIGGDTATTGAADTDVGAVLASTGVSPAADFVAGFLARDAGVFLAALVAVDAVSPEALSASSAATFLARLGLSTIGSRFKPFSSA